MNKIGLIAGNGRFPFLVAQEIRRNNEQVVAIALKEETDPALEQAVDRLIWVNLGKFQALIDTLHAEHITTALMVGQVKHTQLFAGLSLDWRAIKLLGRLVNKKTDTILGAVVDELAREGITLLPSHHYLKHLLPEKGKLTGTKLSGEEQKDVEFGRAMAKKIAGLDIGQTVVVKDGAVVAVESVEGTDECIKRGAALAGANTIVCKVAKPNQDWRFDLPVIGVNTVEVMATAKVRALAVEAGATLLIDREELLSRAREKDLTIIAV
ncbi:MAG: LpxI family protein [Endomicrobiales bacterium]